MSEPRHSLRLESGDRAGETIPIPAHGLSIGRRPENGLRLQESSVSGLHAELKLEGGAVVLRDLGSTNGTRVGGEKVTERPLAHGDVVAFGNVRATLLDATLAEAAPEPGGAGEALRSVGTEAMRRSAHRGKLGLLVLVLVLAVAGGAAFFLLRGGEDTTVAGGPPVREVPGNLLADPSFEDVETFLAWESADAAPEVFSRDGFYRRSGSRAWAPT